MSAADSKQHGIETGAPLAAGAEAARLLGFTEPARADAAGRFVAAPIELAAYAGMTAAFEELSVRARAANPFQSPAAVLAAARVLGPDAVRVLAVRDSGRPDAPLSGVWALRRMRDLWSGGLTVLQAPLIPAFDADSAPVVDKADARGVVTALARAVAVDPTLPGVMRIGSWPLRDTGLLHDSGARLMTAERWERAILAPAAGVGCEDYLQTAMGSAYKKRAAQARALAREGKVAILAHRQDKAVSALQRFMTLEAAGWKGRGGTALAQSPDDALYVQSVIQSLARTDQVCVDEITLDGAPVAIGLVLESGGASVFWKTAFDEAHRRHSPGVLLDLAVTRRLFAEGRPLLDSGMMEFTDPSSQIWSERQPMARASLDVGGGLAGYVVRAGKSLRHQLRLLQRGMRGN